MDNTVYTWYNNTVEDIPELDEAMGSDDGETFDYNGNLDTWDPFVQLFL